MQYNQQVDVKNTMIENILQILAPHYCYGCGVEGQLICDDCKNNIIFDKPDACVVCMRPTGLEGVCHGCRGSAAYGRAWFVGEHKGELQSLINGLKFERVRSAASDLAGLVDESLPELPGNTVLVPVPTIPAHIRQRGYDHTLILAKELAKRRALRIDRSLERAKNTVQFGSSASQREVQAREAFAAAPGLDPSLNYLLLDDIMTTGSTLKYAAKTLQQAGAKNVWLAIVARHTLD